MRLVKRSRVVLSGFYRCVILLLLGSILVFLSFHPLSESQYGPRSDEGYYLRYASQVLHEGRPAFAELTQWYSSSAEARKHPAPVRVGYILLDAFLFHVDGFPSF